MESRRLSVLLLTIKFKIMTNNIQNTQIELIEKKFNVASLLLGIVLTGIACFLFVYSGNIEGNMLSSTMIFGGVVAAILALFLFIAKMNQEVYAKTNSPIVRRQLYYDTADFHNLKNVIDSDDLKSIERFKRIDEGNVQLYVLHSKDRKFAALQLLRYEPFDFIPQTDIKIQEF